MSRFSLSLIFIALLAGCTHTSPMANNPTESMPKPAQQNSYEAEEYAVYSMLLDEIYAPQAGSETESIVISSRTGLDEPGIKDLDQRLQLVRESLPAGIAKEAFSDLQEKNLQIHELTDHFTSKFNVVLLGRDDLEKIYRIGADWSEYLNKYSYPKSLGLISLSRPGFNREMNEALIYTGIQCGGKSGAGYYVLLTRENNVWRIKQKVQTWIS